MTTGARKRVGDPLHPPDTSPCADVQEAICDIWPDGIVEMSLDPGG
jgi:hypothetical protein